ncbi:MAG TPA: alpha/beta hydrolase [Burkholderiales bacterium]|jgi:acetyl esterase/lipase|nr:alpha/beta hydrolase [Burkholderiales bacterium]
MHNVERNAVYGMYSGLALLMDVYHPEKSNGHGIVYINGSGWHSPMAYAAAPLKDTPLGIPYAEALQAAGYTVFAINHRQAPRFRYPAAIEDAQRAVRFVRHNSGRFDISATRIGAAGGSSGGHLVSLLGTLPGDGDPDDQDPVNRESARVQCVVARAAPVDLVRMGERSPMISSFMGMIVRGEAGGPYGVEQQTYRDASPLNLVSNTTVPFLLIAGTQDTIVPPEQTELMHAALKAAGVPVELLWIEGAGHGPGFPGAVNPPDYLGAMVRWFNKHLRGNAA